MNETSERTVEWGTLVTLPGDVIDVEPSLSRGGAAGKVEGINRSVGDGAAKLVYRTVDVGPWRPSDEPGQEWGVRFTWPATGYVEVESRSTRVDAELGCRAYRGDADTEVVTRTVARSDWWLAPSSEGVAA